MFKGNMKAYGWLLVGVLVFVLVPAFQLPMDGVKHMSSPVFSGVKAAPSVPSGKRAGVSFIRKEIPVQAVNKPAGGEINLKLKEISIPFIENIGQADKHVKYYAKTFAGSVFVTADGEIVYSLPIAGKENSSARGIELKEEFVNGTVREITGEGRSETKVSYLRGSDSLKWKSGISTFDSVSLGYIYKGVELKFKANVDNVEKLFVVKPGTETDKIHVKISGANDLKVNEGGELVAGTGLGDVKFTKPVAYQVKRQASNEGTVPDLRHVEAGVESGLSPAWGDREYIEVAYYVNGNEYGFKVEEYDRTRPLIIDPLLGSMTLGGSYSDYGTSIAIDASGNVYVAGQTSSIDFPMQGTPYSSYHTMDDIFIAKLDSDLKNVLASTFMGGSSSDTLSGLAIDPSGNVVISGSSSSMDYPTTAGAYSTSIKCSSYGPAPTPAMPSTCSADIFVSKLDSSLFTLLASTFIGGSGYENAYAMAMDSAGNVYVAGSTTSSDFPTTTGAYKEASSNPAMMNTPFASKLDNGLTSLLASTLITGSGGSATVAPMPTSNTINSMAIDPTGVFVTGTASSSYPTVAGSYSAAYKGGNSDVFVSKFDVNLTTLMSSTFVGGSYEDSGKSIVVDQSGYVYITGSTNSVNFPTTTGAYDRSYSGGDAFVSKLSNDLKTLLASTFIGGSGNDDGSIAEVDSVGNVYVSGNAMSMDFPITKGAFATGTGFGKFISKLDGNLTKLIASTLTGSGYMPAPPTMNGGGGRYLAVDKSQNVYITGSMSLPGAAMNTDAYVYKFDTNLSENAKPILTVAKDGDGSGTITGNGINCGVDCSETITQGSIVSLYANPLSGSTFTGWSGGGCSSLSAASKSIEHATAIGSNICSLTVNADTTVTATFSKSTAPSDGGGTGGYSVTVTKSGDGSGTVIGTPAGIKCGDGCSQTFKSPTIMTLTAKPDKGSVFSGWSGSLSGAGLTYKLKVDSDVTVTATFTTATSGGTIPGGTGGTEDTGEITLSVNIDGMGRVFSQKSRTSKTSGYVLINCGMGKDGDLTGTCETTTQSGVAVTLTATPSTGYDFTGWSDDSCGTKTTCTITMDSSKTITASFSKAKAAVLSVQVDTAMGKVTSSDKGGIKCDSTDTAVCSALYKQAKPITLRVTTLTGYKFTGWSDDNSYTANCGTKTTCKVDVTSSMISDSTEVVVIANFEELPKATVSISLGEGGGKVTGLNINCKYNSDDGQTGTCSKIYTKKGSTTLIATPDAGYTFSGWSDDSGTVNCGTNKKCVVSITNDMISGSQELTLAAQFDPLPHVTVSVSIDGNGKVSGPGITCSYNPDEDMTTGTCSKLITKPGKLILTASPNSKSGSAFDSWDVSSDSAICTSTKCTISVTQDMIDSQEQIDLMAMFN